MGISTYYRGNVKSKEANASVQQMNMNWQDHKRMVSFVEWCPTGFKVGIDPQPIFMKYKYPRDPNDIYMSRSISSVVIVGNNTGISRMFNERFIKKYDLMYSQKAFVHWYLKEGMEEGQFDEAREDLKFLEMDYLDVLCEQDTEDQEDKC